MKKIKDLVNLPYPRTVHIDLSTEGRSGRTEATVIVKHDTKHDYRSPSKPEDYVYWKSSKKTPEEALKLALAFEKHDKRSEVNNTITLGGETFKL